MSCSWLVWKHGKLQLCRWNCRGGGVSPCRAPGGVRWAETELCLPGPGCPPSRAQGAVGISGVPFTWGPSWEEGGFVGCTFTEQVWLALMGGSSPSPRGCSA